MRPFLVPFVFSLMDIIFDYDIYNNDMMRAVTSRSVLIRVFLVLGILDSFACKFFLVKSRFRNRIDTKRDCNPHRL